MVDKGLVTNQIVLTIGYDIENLTDPERHKTYTGPVTTDRYGRKIPKHAHGTANIGRWTSSTMLITKATMELFDQIVDTSLLIRRVNIAANHVMRKILYRKKNMQNSWTCLPDYSALEKQRKEENAALEREKKLQKAALDIKKKFGKNAILKGMNLQDGATAKDRNKQIGGHKA